MKVIEFIYEAMWTAILIVFAILAINWITDMMAMTAVARVAFDADIAINGYPVAIFRSFCNSTEGLLYWIFGILGV